MCYERKIAPPTDATLCFCVKKSLDPQETVHQNLAYTGSDVAALSTRKVANVLEFVVNKSAVALDPVESTACGWQPLLDKLEVFCTVMDGVAEVSRWYRVYSLELSLCKSLVGSSLRDHGMDHSIRRI